MTELATDSRLVHLEQQVQQLTTALVTNRVIATAVGLVMAAQTTDRAHAFAWLVAESQRTNTKLAAVALDLVANAEDAAES
jgi:AmiR/NasT family two-component response regulator